MPKFLLLDFCFLVVCIHFARLDKVEISVLGHTPRQENPGLAVKPLPPAMLGSRMFQSSLMSRNGLNGITWQVCFNWSPCTDAFRFPFQTDGAPSRTSSEVFLSTRIPPPPPPHPPTPPFCWVSFVTSSNIAFGHPKRSWFPGKGTEEYSRPLSCPGQVLDHLASGLAQDGCRLAPPICDFFLLRECLLIGFYGGINYLLFVF